MAFDQLKRATAAISNRVKTAALFMAAKGQRAWVIISVPLNKVATATSLTINFSVKAVVKMGQFFSLLEKIGSSLFLIGHHLISMAFELLCMPVFFYCTAQAVINMANTNNWLINFFIELSKKISIKSLVWMEQLPIIGGLFTPTVLPWVVKLAIGILFISHCQQTWDEQLKIVNQQLRHQGQQDIGVIQYCTLYIKTLFAQNEKNFAMRFLLSLGVPTFYFLFSCLSGVSPVIALSNATWLSAIANLVPYGLAGTGNSLLGIAEPVFSGIAKLSEWFVQAKAWWNATPNPNPNPNPNSAPVVNQPLPAEHVIPPQFPQNLDLGRGANPFLPSMLSNGLQLHPQSEVAEEVLSQQSSGPSLRL